MKPEKCEECGKVITSKMKASQTVIYAGAEHTMSDEKGAGTFPFRDPMFGGVYCCQDCYESQAGIKAARERILAEIKDTICGLEISHTFKCPIKEKLRLLFGELDNVKGQTVKGANHTSPFMISKLEV